MINNLNQLSFQRYGTVEPERNRGQEMAGSAQFRREFEICGGPTAKYRTETQVWLRNLSDMTIISVSENGEGYEHFYLDKVICLKPGIVFSIHPFLEKSTVELAGDRMPEIAGWISRVEDFRMRRHVEVTSIYTFFYHEKEKGFIFPGEAHQPLELTYVDKGSIHSVADGRDILLNQGDLVIYRPNQWHMQYADVDVAASYITICFEMAGDNTEELLNRKLTLPQRAVPLLQQMLQENERMDTHTGDMLITMLQMLLLSLLREQEKPEPTKLRTANAVNSENDIIRRAQQFIGANVRKKISVPVVARHVDVSPSYLTALFRKNLQISPGEYIRRIKLQESKQMIREGNMNFTEIAAALQYSTVHHFSRQFKDKFGITPTEYAKSVR